MNPHPPIDVRISDLPSPVDSVRWAGHAEALARHLDRWHERVALGRAVNGTAVALRAVEPWTTDEGTPSWRFHVTRHPYVEHRAVRDLCAEVRPAVDPAVVSPVWNSGCPLFLAVVDGEGNLLMPRRSATVAVSPNRISPVLTEGCAWSDVRPALPSVMVQRCLDEELGLHAPLTSVQNAMAHTHLVFDPGQTQWGIFSLVRLDHLVDVHRHPAEDAWETGAWVRTPFTPEGLRAVTATLSNELVPGAREQLRVLERLATPAQG